MASIATYAAILPLLTKRYAAKWLKRKRPGVVVLYIALMGIVFSGSGLPASANVHEESIAAVVAGPSSSDSPVDHQVSRLKEALRGAAIVNGNGPQDFSTTVVTSPPSDDIEMNHDMIRLKEALRNSLQR